MLEKAPFFPYDGDGVGRLDLERREHGEVGHVGQQVDAGHQREGDVDGAREVLEKGKGGVQVDVILRFYRS